MSSKTNTPAKVPANRLRILRERSRLTQDEVARVLGCDYTTVSRHENLSRSLDERSITAYAKLYKVRTFEVFVDPLDLRSVISDVISDEIDLLPDPDEDEQSEDVE